MLKLLLTNDDGVWAPGIIAIARRLAEHAEVVVVAPEKPNSARSHCITLHKPLRLNRMPPYDLAPGRGSLDVHACSGTPVDCVVLGVDHVCREHKPDIVISGINDGYNVAEDLLYSGTVGGAVEGAINRIPSFSISQGSFKGMDFDESAALVDMFISALVYGSTFSWHQDLRRDLLSRHDAETEGVLELSRIEEDSHSTFYPAPAQWWPDSLATTPCINLNLPKVPVNEIRGMCWAVSGQRDYIDVVQQREDPFGRQYFWIAGERVLMEEQPGTDTWALSRRLVSATPMHFDMSSRADLQPFRAHYPNRD
ncbi:MAG: 5'/3'-nucleotidase SurE [Planctomycetales bacterium]|nr:5'/3'-nucleotidase SurE [bacterium]UNM07876.1 MAG: 5'/3'-nucleotidase SurE [Planctomycetales bacterium]